MARFGQLGGLEEVDPQHHYQWLQGMTEAGVRGHGVINQRQQQKGPGEQPGAWHFAVKRQGKSQQAADTAKNEIQTSGVFHPLGSARWMGNAGPEKEDSLEGVAHKEHR